MARSFNGSSDRITIGTGFTPSEPLTVAAWIYLTSTPTTGAMILCSVTTNGFNFYPNHSLKLTADHTDTAALATGIGTVTLNTWQHVAFSYSSGHDWKLYLNGAVDNSGNNAQSIGGQPYAIGYSAHDNNYYFSGNIADVAVWSAILTDSEVASLNRGVRPYMVRQKSLSLYYPLDGISSPEPDLSSNAYSGTLSGTALASGPPVTLFSPKGLGILPTAITAASAAYRKTQSSIGTRIGSRQMGLS